MFNWFLSTPPGSIISTIANSYFKQLIYREAIKVGCEVLTRA